MTMPRVSGLSRSGRSVGGGLAAPRAMRRPRRRCPAAARSPPGVGLHISAAAPPCAGDSFARDDQPLAADQSAEAIPAPHHHTCARWSAIYRRHRQFHAPQALGGALAARRCVSLGGRDESRRLPHRVAQRDARRGERRRARQPPASAAATATPTRAARNAAPSLRPAPRRAPQAATTPNPATHRRPQATPRRLQGQAVRHAASLHVRSHRGDALERRHNRVANARNAAKVL